MKKKIIISLIFMLFVMFSYTSYAHAESYDTIKLGLFFGNTQVDSVEIGSEAGLDIGYEADGEFVSVIQTENPLITVQKGRDMTIVALDITTFDTSLGTFTIKPLYGNLTVNGKEYRGCVQILRTDISDMTVINKVSMEEYLYGVVGREMSSSWEIEALKAQAVCAKNYAITNYNKFAKYGFNLCTTTVSQVYGGVSAESESVREAVDAVAGKMLMYDGSPAQTYFFATSGGHTADVKNVWGSSIPYLCGVEDPYEDPKTSGHYTWKAEKSADEIKAILENKGKDIGDIVNVEVTETDDAGYVLEIVITGTSGTHTIKKSEARAFFGSGIYSQNYTITAPEGNSVCIIGATGKTTKSVPTLVSVTGKLNTNLCILGANGVKTTVKGGGNGNYVFNGKGYGHGIGMSQNGARGMAKLGYTYDQILTHYYPGTYITPSEEIIEP